MTDDLPKPVTVAGPDPTHISGVLAQAHAAWSGGDRSRAIATLTAVATRTPDAGAIWSRLGGYLLEVADIAAAESALRRAVDLMPHDAACWTNLGTALLRLTRPDEAIAAYNRAIELDAAAIGVRINLGNALQRQGDIDAAVAQLEQVRILAPESAEALNNLGNLYKEQGRFDDAFAAYAEARRVDPDFRPAFSNLLALTKTSPRHTAADVFALHRAFARRFEFEWEADYEPPANVPHPTRRLRLGYVSPDCHTALPAFLEPVLRAHDRERFEVFVYFNNPQPKSALARISPVQSRVMKGASDGDVAAWIRRDSIDILIDIAGHTGHNRLGVFGRKPAPVQVTWLDYLNTTGLDAIDYRLTDAVTDPPGESDVLHSETLLRLAPTQWCWAPPSPPKPPESLPALAAGHLTLGSFNNHSKLTDETLALWARLLLAVPEARLCIVGVPKGFARSRLTRAFSGAGDRVQFRGRLSPEDYRRAIAAVDIALDPLPFSGATTTLDALWQGVPVVTAPGATNTSRSTASLLTALHLTDWIASSDEQYITIVARAAADLPRLAALRADVPVRLAQSSVCNAAQFTRQLEGLLSGAWRAWFACRARDTVGEAAKPAAGTVAASPHMLKRRRLDESLAAIESAIRDGKGADMVPSACALIDEMPHWPAAQRAYLRVLLAWSRTQQGLYEREFPPVAAPAKPPRISVVICSIDPARFSNVVRCFESRFAGYPMEIVGVHDARSLAEGYNRGATRARGDILVFCHDDIELITPDFAARLVAHLVTHDGIGVAGASEAIGPRWGDAGQRAIHGHILHPPPPGKVGALLMASGFQAPVCTNIRLLDGVFIAVRREVWEVVRFDADRFDGFHLYDLDFTWRASRGGASLAVPADLTLFHASTGRYTDAWRRYARRFVESAGLDPLADRRPGGLQTRLETLDQINALRAAMLHFRFGAP